MKINLFFRKSGWKVVFATSQAALCAKRFNKVTLERKALYAKIAFKCFKVLDKVRAFTNLSLPAIAFILISFQSDIIESIQMRNIIPIIFSTKSFSELRVLKCHIKCIQMTNLTFVISALCLSRKRETWIFTLKTYR